MYVKINKDEVPYMADIEVDNTVYTFYVKYNTAYDYFTFDVLIGERKIVNGYKLMYGTPLFQEVVYKDIPPIDYIPLDVGDSSKRCGFVEMDESIFVFIGDMHDPGYLEEYNAILKELGVKDE